MAWNTKTLFYHKQLDDILSLLLNATEDAPLTATGLFYKYKEASGIKIITRNQNIIIHKLLKDEVILTIKETINNTRTATDAYYISFKGLILSESGGYEGQVYRETIQERRDQISRFLTWILAVGVISPFLWYSLDMMDKYDLDNQCVFWGALGLITGIVIGVLIRQRRK